MPGHDHSLRKLYTIEGLSNPSMVYNWICPVLLKEDCPYEALACIFSTYFKDTSGINTSEDPTLLRVGLVHYETLHQKDALVSTFFWLFLSLKIITMFCNLVLLSVCKYATLPTTLQFVSICCPRSFWIPGPSLRSMATAHLV